MFELRVPVRSEKLLKNIDKPLREDLLGFSWFDSQRIEAKRICLIRRVKYDNIILARVWYMHHDLIDEVSMRIDDRESLPIRDIVYHLSHEELTFSDSGFSYDIHMTEPILIIDTDRDTDTSVVRLSKYREPSIMCLHTDLSLFHHIGKYRHPDRQGELFCVDLEECCLSSWIIREVIHTRYLIGREDEFFSSLTYDV